MGRTVQKQGRGRTVGISIGKGLMERNLREAGKEQEDKQKNDGSVSMEPKAGTPRRTAM